jgi:aminoglycoside phosphotransferase (APT) family kinase protein
MFWTEPGEFNAGRVNEPTQAPGYITKREGIDRYAARTGRDVSGVDFYISLAFWRLACITEGVLARYVNGAMGSNQSIDLTAIGEGVRLLAQSALDSAKRLV